MSGPAGRERCFAANLCVGIEGRERMKFVLFTDLDGTLLDANYSCELVKPVVEELKRKGVPIVFCTTKTRAECEYYRRELRINDPFIVENGSAIFIPVGYFTQLRCERRGNFCVLECVRVKYEDAVRALAEISAEAGVRVKGFGDLTAEQVAEIAAMPLELAKLAKRREYTETFFFEHASEGAAVRKLSEEIERFFAAAEKRGFRISHGGRFYSIQEKNADKGKAVRILTNIFRREFGVVRTFGIGDSENDIPMLRSVDCPALVRSRSSSGVSAVRSMNFYKASGFGAEGWIEIVKKFILTQHFNERHA